MEFRNDLSAMAGTVCGATTGIVASAGWWKAGGPDDGIGDTRGASFADELVAGTCAAGSGGATGASGTSSAGVASSASGVAGNAVSALVSPSAVLMWGHRLGSVAAGFVMPASGDMT